ncbi:hypothetical protein HCUR_00909 [Holospora curviuscula]|uniref:Transposase IS4-like domain-containing protein n=1 Tax=Holospora curviuscula TaxID=1082868 RepID=A0A2S5R8L1_9PROT|nr:hypothetical protein HCUR_00909 [Holospora curviuscula]
MNKSNALTVILKILDWLDSKGSILTIDAMRCQNKIADKIMGIQLCTLLQLTKAQVSR